MVGVLSITGDATRSFDGSRLFVGSAVWCSRLVLSVFNAVLVESVSIVHLEALG